MTSPVPAAEEAELLQRLTDLLDTVRRKTTELVDTVDRTLRALPAAVAAPILAATRRLVDLVRQAYDALTEILGSMGSPSTLWRHAAAWSDNVGGPVSGLASDADLDRVQADDSWTGEAADAYRNALGPQKAALAAVKATLADGIATALSETAKAIVVFWGLLVAGLAALVTGIIGAIASSATIVGLPAGPFVAAGAAAAFLACFFAGGMNLRSAAADQNVRLRQRLDDDTSFRDGHWPRPAADPSDGSIGDGTPSGWRLKGA
ncbi:hypothetical protein HC031_02285 [Planosporangium thailandense]|uniref:WXG100 family type VII secretion target n=1 Tax=Planosporangium thailandense TaxID=765197 RepID=A0ABX0XRM7_9ACTN|nr:hypothetical protein [Planosporangium thailandense]NJC68557.1 hypothetical protein [Planosporangium thailandense]